MGLENRDTPINFTNNNAMAFFQQQQNANF